MINFFGTKKPEPPRTTEIGKETSFEGELESKAEIEILGSFKGNVKSALRIATGRGSRFEGTLSAPAVTVEGSFKGGASASEILVLKAAASAEGDFKAKRIVVEKGAYVSGKVS